MGESRASGDREIFERFLVDMIAGRYDEIASKLAPEVVWHLPPFARQPPMEGREAVLRFLREASAAFYQEGSMRLEPIAFMAEACLLYTSPSPRDVEESRMPSSA